MSFQKLRDEVIDKELCTGCGTCVGICPTSAIRIDDPYSYHPDFFDSEVCVNCGLCISVCPALGYDVYCKSAEDQLFNRYIGYHRKLYSGHASDSNLRGIASAGGVATEILRYLIENDEVDKVCVVQNTDDLRSGLAYPEITDSVDAIIKARQSKYVQVPVGRLLKDIMGSDERFAIVGLPCHLAGLKRAEDRVPKLREKIVFKIGLFCGYAYTPNCIKGLLSCMGLNRNDVKRVVGWRMGGIPGSFTVLLQDGRTEEISFVEEHCIDITFYSLLRCHMCVDWSCVYSDISLGDIGGWRRENLVIARTTMGERLLQAMNRAGKLQLQNLSLERAWRETGLPFMVNAKTVRSNLFIDYLARLGGATPEWNVQSHTKSPITRLFSNRYFRELLNTRRRLEFYERNPRLMRSRGRYIYLHFWNRSLFRAIRKARRVLFKSCDL